MAKTKSKTTTKKPPIQSFLPGKTKSNQPGAQFLIGKEFFLYEWTKFANRYKIHEILKCLQIETSKLHILEKGKNSDVNELLMGAGLSPMPLHYSLKQQQEEERKALEKKRRDKRLKKLKEKDFKKVTITDTNYDTDADDEHDTTTTEAEDTEDYDDTTTDDDENIEKKRLGAFDYNNDEETIENVLNFLPLKEEIKISKALEEELRLKEIEQDYIVRAAIRLFGSDTHVTRDQFNVIAGFCKTRHDQIRLAEAYAEKLQRDKYLAHSSEKRKMLYQFLNSHFFNRFILLLIAISTLIIVLLTFEFIEIRYTFPLSIIDTLIISIFFCEAICKIYIFKIQYFKSVWNILDLAIIATHFVEIFVELVTKLLALSTNINGNLVFRLLKSLRSLRLLRTIKFLPNLQVIVSTILHSLVSLSSIAILMGLVIVVFGVVGRGLFNEQDPTHFHSIWQAMLTLFQLLTLDDWYDLPDDFEEGASIILYITFIFYLFVYILVEYFVFLNLFIAVLVDNFQIAIEEVGAGRSKRSPDFEQFIRDAEEAEEMKKTPFGMEMLKIEDYYHGDPNSPEMKLYSENLKLLTALDYQYNLLVQRLKFSGVVMDIGVSRKRDAWITPTAPGYQAHPEVDIPLSASLTKLQNDEGEEDDEEGYL